MQTEMNTIYSLRNGQQISVLIKLCWKRETVVLLNTVKRDLLTSKKSFNSCLCLCLCLSVSLFLCTCVRTRNTIIMQMLRCMHINNVLSLRLGRWPEIIKKFSLSLRLPAQNEVQHFLVAQEVSWSGYLLILATPTWHSKGAPLCRYT